MPWEAMALSPKSIAYVDINNCFENFKYAEGYVSISY